jgi:hypothetical protein
LADIQAQSGTNLPEAPSEDAIQNLLAQAQSSNLTDSVGRSLLVKLTSAGVQGLGSDIPTQETIISEATAQMNASLPAATPATLNKVEATPDSLRDYGNGVILAIAHHPKANTEETLSAVGKATDSQSSASLPALKTTEGEYRALAQELQALPVPTTLAPLHGQVVQNFFAIADCFADMQDVISDPLRGLTAIQRYQALVDEQGRLLTNIGEALQKGGILFSKDEPGSAWGTLLSAT